MIVCAECESWDPEDGKCARGMVAASPSHLCAIGKPRKPERRELPSDMEGQSFLFGGDVHS